MAITITINEAIEIANKAHDGQVDRAGAPYIKHVVRVANNVIDGRHKILALLHDVMEDTDMNDGDLFKLGVDPETLGKLKLLTRRKGQAYDEYIKGICTDFDTCIVKLADLRDNMDITRLQVITDKDWSRLAKYHKAYFRILETVNKMVADDEELQRGPKQ